MAADHFLQPLLQGAGQWALSVDGRDTIVATRLETAFDSKTRNRGLLGRESLDPDTALIIAPGNAIHTFFMRFPIDLIYVKRDGSIVKIRHAVPPWRISAAFNAFAVIEMAAGAARRAGITAGDRLAVKQL